MLRGDGDRAHAVLRGVGQRRCVVDRVGHRGGDDGRGSGRGHGDVDRLPAELETHRVGRARARGEGDDAARGGAARVGHGAGVERGVRRRTHRLAGALVVGEARRHGRKGDREIGAVAGAHAAVG